MMHQNTGDLAASVTGKISVASGAGTAVYSASSGHNMIAILSIVFTAATFFVNWYYERRNAQLAEDKAARELELQQQRLEMEAHDRDEKRRIMEEAWARAEKRRDKQGQEMLAEMRRNGRPAFRDSGMQPLDFGATDLGGGK